MKKLNKVILGLLVANIAFLNSNAMKRGAGEVADASAELFQRRVKAREDIRKSREDNRIVPIDNISNLSTFLERRRILGNRINVDNLDIHNLNSAQLFEILNLRKFIEAGNFDELSVNKALTIAATYGCLNIIQELLNNPESSLFIKDAAVSLEDVEDQYCYGVDMAIIMSVEGQYFECFKYLINHPVSFDVLGDVAFNTSFISAVDKGNLDICLECLSNKRLFNLLEDYAVNEAFVIAADKGLVDFLRPMLNHERIKHLIKSYMEDPDLIPEDRFGEVNYGANAALRFAAINGHCEALQTIINNQMTLDLIDEFTANDALAEVTVAGHIDVIRILLSERMAHLVNREGINVALGITQSDDIRQILNADQRI